MIFRENFCSSLFTLEYWVENFIPLLIAIIALAFSIYQSILNRKAYISANRPFVWASNSINSDTGEHIPNIMLFIVKNVPAKIIEQNYSILLGDEEIMNYKETEFARYPNEKTLWTLTINQEKLNKAIKDSKDRKALLTSRSYIKYSHLNGGREYFHELHEEYDHTRIRWKPIQENGN